MTPTPKDNALLQVKKVVRRYTLPRTSLVRPAPHFTAVNAVSFTLMPGQTLGIVGESGSGKSTLARLIMAFEAPQSGQVLFDGHDVHHMPKAQLRALRAQFQMVFQDPYGSLNPRRKVGWSIAEPLRALTAQERMAQKVDEALECVGLRTQDAQKYPHEFSGGQRQRIAIARAIITRPSLLVADEAVSALDVSVQAQILNLLADLQEQLGLSMVFISHDLAVVGCICDQILVMKSGQAIEHGDAHTLLTAPQTDYTHSLLTAAGLL